MSLHFQFGNSLSVIISCDETLLVILIVNKNMSSIRGHVDSRAKDSPDFVSPGAHKECLPILPSLAVQACENSFVGESFTIDSARKMEAKEALGHGRLQPDIMDITDSPTIVKSKSLSKKIRERQTRDKAASDADRTIPSLYTNGSTKSLSMLKSMSQASNLSSLEGNSGELSDDSPPPGGSDISGYLPVATVTPNRSRSTSASAPSIEGIASPEHAPTNQSMPLSWTSTHTNLTSIISSGVHNESMQYTEESKLRSHDGHHSPPSNQLANLHLNAISSIANIPIYHNQSSARLGLSSTGIAVTTGSKVHQSSSTAKVVKDTHKDAHVHAVERTLPPKSLEKINPTERVSASSGSSGSSRSGAHNRSAVGASNSSKLSALSLSPAQTSAKSRAASSSTSTMMSLHGLQNPAQVVERQFLIALEGPPRAGPPTIEDDNDRIVQERLLEAKAMDRGKASGAVMHQFSLWNKVPAKSAQSPAEVVPVDKASSIANDESPRLASANRLTSLSPSLHNASVGSEPTSTSGKKLRGPKAALAIQSLADEEPRNSKPANPFAMESAAFSSRTRSRTPSNDFFSAGEVMRASITSVTSTVTSTPDLESNGIVPADRSFNSDTLDEDYTMEFEPLAGEIAKAADSDVCAIPLGGSAGSSLAAALRKKVGGAKQSSSSNESLQALNEGNGPEGSPVKAHDPLTDKMVYVTPEKRFNPLPIVHAPVSQHAGVDVQQAEANYEDDHDGWYDDDFAEEDEELRRISERPRSAEGNIKRRSQSEIDTEAIIRCMSKSGPAAFASPRSANKVNEGHAASGLTMHAPHARNATQGEADNSPERGVRNPLTLSAPTSTSDKTSLRRATTSGESRLLINQLEALGQVEPDSPTTMKSMTSRSASEYHIPADAVAALNARTTKGGSSKYQTLRNLKSNKSERFQITPMASTQNLNKSSEITSEVDQNTNNNPNNIASAGEPLQASSSTTGQHILKTEEVPQNAEDAEIEEEEEEEEGDEDRNDASPTLSELSETEDPPEMRRPHSHVQRQQQQQQDAQRQSPLRLEALHTFGTSSAEGHEHLLHNNKDQADEEESPLRWKRGEAIGEGTFGKVYKGMNEKTGELLAIKQLALMDGSSAEVDSLRREISVMWNLEHENIVRYMGTSKTDRYLYIILEYVTGGSIAGMITQFGPFTEKLIKRFSFHILSGVEYLHSKGIVHRDIKGGNILVSDAGVAKLADFGCSKQLAGVCTGSIEESMKAIRGSVPWMAPEVIKQSGHGRPSDIWSFGATVIEMATGKPPWPEFTNSMAALFHVATSSSPPPMPDNVSSLCTDFLGRCLVIDPADRATASQLLTETEFLRGSVVPSSSGSNTATASSAAAIASSNDA